MVLLRPDSIKAPRSDRPDLWLIIASFPFRAGQAIKANNRPAASSAGDLFTVACYRSPSRYPKTTGGFYIKRDRRADGAGQKVRVTGGSNEAGSRLNTCPGSKFRNHPLSSSLAKASSSRLS
ncbi:unnamed protein product [Nezara viridula]|uniref:Uncharacterized protein n=1 Tax=Nezara viridula TaxID=85310 RepID=A0A9P0E3K3_NEZVI|nr:unnamed protein product [Nezara viridula]